MISALVQENLLKSGKILLSSKVTKSDILSIITNKLRWKYKVLIGRFLKKCGDKIFRSITKAHTRMPHYTKSKESGK